MLFDAAGHFFHRAGGQGDEADLGQRPVTIPHVHPLVEIGLKARNRLQVGQLDVDVERARAGVLEAGDVVVGRLDPVHRQALHLALVLFEIGIAEDAHGVLVALDLLDDQIVLLALVDIFAVGADFGAGPLERVLVTVLQGFHRRVGFATRGQDQFLQRVARAAGRRRTVDQDRGGGQ